MKKCNCSIGIRTNYAVGVGVPLVGTPMLTDLVATENDKEYIANDYGVDGFGKVKTELRNLVKVYELRVTNDCINEDGRWEGETLIDTSNVTDMGQMFRGCTLLEEIDVSNFDTSKVTRMWYMFDGVKSVNGYENWNTSNVVDMQRLFGGIPNMRKLDLHNWDVRKVGDFWTFLYGAFYLEEIDITGWETPSVFKFDMFTHSNKLWTLLGGKGIDEVLQKDIYTLKGIKVSFSLNKTIIDRASLRAVINGLADLTGQNAQTLTLGETLRAKLTEEDTAIATNKNWTIV